jgi:ATP-dependent helicase/nuclease subunit A
MRKAAERGRLLHALFERLPDVPTGERREVALAWLREQGGTDGAEMAEEICDHALRVLDDPAHAALFSPDGLAEAPIAAVVAGQVIAGTVDRLLVRDDAVHVADFKTGRAVPQTAAEVPLSHLRQMAAYAAALGVIFPGRSIRASLLYTSGPRLIDLPEEWLAANKPGFAAPAAEVEASRA